ncbi:MAG: putative pyridoxal-dependent aspartate 1-decarboxylase [Pseudomonadota bacterium]|nr:putative pyridoxal-dependent aspartate 1-decarboxylase [Pseudomonadota bacterium]
MQANQELVDLEHLRKIFSCAVDTKLQRIEADVVANLHEFLSKISVAADSRPQELEQYFQSYRIPDAPTQVSEQADFLQQQVVAHAVNISSPKFIGHMVSVLPSFVLPLAKIMTALNQNLVKTETSKSFTPLERQVVGMLHHLVYQRDESFYRQYLHSRQQAIGVFCSGGTIANITALWVARNKLLASRDGFAGVHVDGVTAALRHYGYRDLAMLVSQRGHYSLAKAADILGIGRKMLISVATDRHDSICSKDLRAKIKALRAQRVAIVALIGIAGTTETGGVDDLNAMAAIANDNGCHFHVDAAWGGAALFSVRHRQLLAGIAAADSVVIDAHKQLYTPIGAGVLLCKNPTSLDYICQQANYIIRTGSRDLGRHTLEGSRAGIALLVHSTLHILGQRSFELLINSTIATAKQFAELIIASQHFELITAPTLNILTYRYHPQPRYPLTLAAQRAINRLTTDMQRRQRSAGESFVSRTTLALQGHQEPVVVFRVVIANPLTTLSHLREVLDEQVEIAASLLADSGCDLYDYR